MKLEIKQCYLQHYMAWHISTAPTLKLIIAQLVIESLPFMKHEGLLPRSH
jgi:hypothetical protein